MIRKPGEEDFRESMAVTAVRETGKIAVEGSRGIGSGFTRLLTYWFGGMIALMFLVSAAAAMGPLGFIAVPAAVIWGVKYYRKRQADRVDDLRRVPQAYRVNPAPIARAEPVGDFAFPADVRRQARIELNIGAVAQQTMVLFMLGFFCMILMARHGPAGITIIAGPALVMTAVLVGSRVFGDRTALAWDTRTVTVHQMLSKGTMQWADVTHVSVEKCAVYDPTWLFLSGSRRNIVIGAAYNRLGGPLKLRVPIRLLGLSKPEIEHILRDLFCWQAAGQSAGDAAPAPRVATSQVGALPFVEGPLPWPGTQRDPIFDADRIMERYLAGRSDAVANALREELPGNVVRQRSAPIPQRPVFGRKVV